jgi:hypothetical protein
VSETERVGIRIHREIGVPEDKRTGTLEVSKSRHNRDRPLEEDTWQQSSATGKVRQEVVHRIGNRDIGDPGVRVLCFRIAIRDFPIVTEVGPHRSWQADRWHIASRELVSGRAENLVSRVAKARGHEVARRNRDRPSGEDAWQRSRDLANSGVRRVKAQALGIPSHEGARSEKENSHWIWIVGGPLDPHVGSCIGVSREKAREFGHGDREIARSDTPISGASCQHSREGGQRRSGGQLSAIWSASGIDISRVPWTCAL